MILAAYNLNNNGVSFGTWGKPNLALKKFRQGFEAMVADEALTAANDHSPLALHTVPVTIGESDVSGNEFLYKKVFALGGLLKPSWGILDVALCTAVLQYNAALCLHVTREQGYRSESLRLYRTCLRTLAPLSLDPQAAAVTSR